MSRRTGGVAKQPGRRRVRTIKDPSERRAEILEVARRLVETRGYEQMTVQDILDELELSKGAFYHYFDSKLGLLEALVERMGDEMEAVAAPIVADRALPAVDKLRRLFDRLARWKTGQKAFLLALLRVWYADENVRVREKARVITRLRLEPLLTAIVREGTRQGVFASGFPEHVGKVVLSLLQGLNEEVGVLVLRSEGADRDAGLLESTIAAYTEALHRALGMPPGSVEFVDPATLEEWLVLAESADAG